MPAVGNPCPINGCTRNAKPQQLMCWPHWRRVPKSLNHAVFDTFRAYNTAKPGTGIDDRYLEYLTARDAAIAAVDAKEAEEAIASRPPRDIGLGRESELRPGFFEDDMP